MKFNSLVPELSVSNIEKSLKFYTKILGFVIEYRRTENKFAFLSRGDAQLMIQESNGKWEAGNLKKPFGRGINFQITVENIDSLLKSLKKSDIKFGPEENWYRKGDVLLGCKEVIVSDPDGYLLRFSQDIGEKIHPFRN